MAFLKLLTLAITVSLTSAVAQTDTQSAPSPPPWSAGPIDFSGLIDVYYSFNENHPASQTNTLRNFDVRANQFSLNMAKLVMEHSPDPVGFRIDLGFGRAFEVFHFAELGPTEDGIDVMRNIMQAYVSVKPANMGDLQIDFGKFVTSAGAEPTETHLNWNYSRSLLYANGPYYHFGVRVAKPFGSHFTGGVQIINGWNNVEDNNSGKTVGLTAALTSSKVSWFNNYYVGPENTGTNTGIRNFWDTVVSFTPNDKFNAYFNLDVGRNTTPDKVANDWWGVSVAGRYMPNDWFALSPRIEYYSDSDGYITGQVQKLKEFTLTADFKMKQGFLWRLEFRRDWSDKPYYDYGYFGQSDSMTTLLAGFIAYFGPR